MLLLHTNLKHSQLILKNNMVLFVNSASAINFPRRSLHMTAVVCIPRVNNITDPKDLPMSVYTDYFLGSNYSLLSRSLQSLGNYSGQAIVAYDSNSSISGVYVIIMCCAAGLLVVTTLYLCNYPSIKPITDRKSVV